MRQSQPPEKLIEKWIGHLGTIDGEDDQHLLPAGTQQGNFCETCDRFYHRVYETGYALYTSNGWNSRASTLDRLRWLSKARNVGTLTALSTVFLANYSEDGRMRNRAISIKK